MRILDGIRDRRSGALVDQPPKQYSGKKGDVDVLATFTFPPYVIGYQVKFLPNAAPPPPDAVEVQGTPESLPSNGWNRTCRPASSTDDRSSVDT
jgi:hypothetical protein